MRTFLALAVFSSFLSHARTVPVGMLIRQCDVVAKV